MNTLLANAIEWVGRSAITVCVAVVVSVGVIKYVPGLVPVQGVVVLDAVRLNNAFRHAAAPLIGKDQEGKEVTATELSVTGKRTMEVIQHRAGGRLVLIKQATVGDSNLEDITVDVITELGLKDVSAVPFPDPDETIDKLKRYSGEGAAPKESQRWQDRVLP